MTQKDTTGNVNLILKVNKNTINSIEILAFNA
jgi:hypothetical protein